MNVLKMADGFAGLFPKKVKVKLFHFRTGDVIGACKMDNDLIPETFNKPTQIDINGALWRIMKAEIVRENSYLRSRLIHFHVQELYNNNGLAPYNVPTYSYPGTEFSEQPLFNEFSIRIFPEEWRQIEFLPVSHISAIQETIEGIKAILKSTAAHNLRGYDSMFVRESVANNNLQIPFELFCSTLDVKQKGNVELGKAFIKNAVSLKTNDHVYYGILQNGIITDLALQDFDFMDGEIIAILDRFELMLAAWCEPAILVYGREEGAKEETLSFEGEII